MTGKAQRRWQSFTAAITVSLLLAGCASMATQQLAENLSSAMLNQDDPDTVRAGAPAYLLLIDGLIRSNPDDKTLLIAGSRLYGAFATGLIKKPGRVRRMTDRSRRYARQALCHERPLICESEDGAFDQFEPAVRTIEKHELEMLYTYAISWAGWIKSRTGDWGAIADLPKVELLLQRVIDLEPEYDQGRAQLYLGVMRSQLPAALGGKPEAGRKHFELAILYSKGRDLMAKVEYARQYARLIFDQELHDRLLNEVLKADPNEPDLVLSNILAQQAAQELLTDDYF